MNKKISIITLTYNQLEKTTKPYINSLYKHTDPSIFELIIIDNNSTDGTVEYLKDLENQKDNITVIYNNENLGYSKGNNQGLKISKGDYIGLLNNDILLSPNWLEPLLSTLEIKNAGMVSPKAIQSCFVKESNFHKETLKLKNEKKEEITLTVKCDFSCVILKNDLINSLGYLDENFSPAYFEDDDYCVRSVIAGYENYICNKSYIYHKTSSTGKKIADIEKIYNKNKDYFLEKYKNNPFIKHLFLCNAEYQFIKPRFERLKRYKSTSLKYYLDKLLRK